MPASICLDHLAIGVEAWSDGFPVLVGKLGGQWSHGGDGGEYAPCQMTYRDGMRLELISPGSSPTGFMHRFLDRSGPGPHHLTFKVPSLNAVLADIALLGIEPLGLTTRGTFWREAFLHPKQAGMGTLLQLVEADEAEMANFRPPAPEGFPILAPPPAEFAWIGLTVESLDRSDALFERTLAGTVTDAGTGWRLYSWGPQRRLLVRDHTATPGGRRFWQKETGVAHLVVASSELSPRDEVTLGLLRHRYADSLLGLAIWAPGEGA